MARCFRCLGAPTVVLLALAAATPARAGLVLTPAFSGSVNQPIHVTAPLGDDSRLFVVERPGRVRLALDGVIQTTPFIDISGLVSEAGEGGLLSIAFAPDYATSGLFYAYYVEDPDAPGVQGDIRIDEFRRSAGDPNVADPSATYRRPILEVQHDDHDNHYGGQVAFGADGLLYAGTGDGGGGGDPDDNAQNPASQLGKLLAIAPAGPTVTTAAMGLRNPFRFSFDRVTGDLVLGDVGQGSQEEINWLTAGTFSGKNFGWDCWEGDLHLKPACNPASYVPPIHTYVNPAAAPAAVTGGVVVRDPALGSLFGRYVYADYYDGNVRSLKLGAPASEDRAESELPEVPNLVAFGEDASGRVYVVSLAGSVQRIACEGTCAAPAGPPPPDGTPAPTDPGTTTAPVQNPPATAPARDAQAPVLSVRAARRQSVLQLRRVRLSVACDENCFVRVTARARGIALRGVLRRLTARDRVVLTLLASKRVRRALARRGVVSLTVKARDAAGNVRSRRLTVLVKRPR